MGGLMARLSKFNIEGNDPIYRNVNPSDVVLIVNPTDYWSKVFPAKTVLTANGEYVQVLPVPFQICSQRLCQKEKQLLG